MLVRIDNNEIINLVLRQCVVAREELAGFRLATLHNHVRVSKVPVPEQCRLI